MNKNGILLIGLAALWVLLDCSPVSAGPFAEKIRERIQQNIDSKKSIAVDGRERTYLVHLPRQYRKGELYPLVLVLHGGTGNAENALRMSGMNPKADQEGFIVVYPNGTGKLKDKFLHWNDGSQRSDGEEGAADDIAFFRQLIAQMERDYSVDPKRIYATGISNGAIMTYRLGCELSDKLAAIAPVAGALNYNQSVPSRPLAVIIFHGTADQYVPYNGGVGQASGGRTRNDQSVAYAVNFWVKHNGCNPIPIKEETGSIVKERYTGGRADTEVVLYTIKNGGHSWPGGTNGIRYGNADPPTQEISATDLIWEFFKQHSLHYGVNDHHFSLLHEGRIRKYNVHLPSAYNKDVPAPMVIYLHGGGGDMRAAFMDGLDKMSDKYGFILAVPEGTGEVKLGHLRGVWNGGKWATGECCGNADDVGFIAKMIDEIKNNFNVDERRVYATGISNGGLMTNRLGCELSDKIAAIAPVAPAAIMSDCSPERPMPVMVIHGTADPANPPDGSEPRTIFKEGASPFGMPYKRMTPYQVVDVWKKMNQCSESQVAGYQNDKVKCVIYNDCAQGAEVELCIVEGMGHTYPSGSQYLPAEVIGPVSDDISFDQIWEFFAKHPQK